MAGSDFTFNISKGKVAYYVTQIGAASGPFTGAKLGFMLLINNVTFPLEADSTMKDKATIAALCFNVTSGTGPNYEAEPDGGAHSAARVTGYARKFVSAFDPTGADPTKASLDVNATTDRAESDSPDQLWSPLGGANNSQIGKLITYLNPTGASADTACIPLTGHNYDVLPDGSDVAALVTVFHRAIDG
jgi:hypothetical protein